MKTAMMIIATCLLIILGLGVFNVFGYFEPPIDREITSKAFYTLAKTTDFLDMIKECKVEKSYITWTNGAYVAIDQDCNGVDKTILVDVLNDYPSFHRVNRNEVPFVSFS